MDDTEAFSPFMNDRPSGNRKQALRPQQKTRLLLRCIALAACLAAGGLPAANAAAAKPKSPLEAIFDAKQYETFLRQAVPAAQAGDAQAQYLLGKAYQSGSGVAADGAQALHYYQLAAKQDHPRALNNLGLLLLQGDPKRSLPPDPVAAEAYLKRALALGLKLPTLYNLGTAKWLQSDFMAAGDYHVQAYEAGFGDTAIRAAMISYAREVYSPYGISDEMRAELYRKTLPLAQLAFEKGLGTAMQNMGAIYLLDKKYDQAWPRAGRTCKAA